MKIEELIEITAKCFQAGAAEHVIKYALQYDGIPRSKADIIIRWAKAKAEVTDEIHSSS